MPKRPATELQAPPADDPHSTGAWGAHRTAPPRHGNLVESLVQRCLDPATGLASKVLDPLGDDPNGREKARMIVLDAIAWVALHGRVRGIDTAGDDRVRAVLARTAEASLEGLIGSTRSVQPPAGTAPGLVGPLRLAVLQDATAALRRVDRQVACVVLAAGVPSGQAAVLLGLSSGTMTASMRRITRRIAEATAGPRVDPL